MPSDERRQTMRAWIKRWDLFLVTLVVFPVVGVVGPHVIGAATQWVLVAGVTATFVLALFRIPQTGLDRRMLTPLPERPIRHIVLLAVLDLLVAGAVVAVLALPERDVFGVSLTHTFGVGITLTLGLLGLVSSFGAFASLRLAYWTRRRNVAVRELARLAAEGAERERLP